MDEKRSRRHFEAGEDEISEVWPVLQSVIQVPALEKRHDYSAWPRFPAPIFQASCDLALLGEDLFLSESQFSTFKEFLLEAGEDEFMLLLPLDSSEEKPYELFRYPADLPWPTLNDPHEDVPNEAVPGVALSVLDHGLVGPSGRWGMWWVEPWRVYVVGYTDEKVLRALQRTYDFEGRGAEVVDSLPKRWEAKRLHEIADEIRAQEGGAHPS
ncbi:hypothetical protein CRI93_14100 [Longimonas halophila]|uniref:Uncharacterized protein n=1 Tax=Longimonas halophila TaxID=1469170 RepID=A0A2H3NIB2_9BACT|nr:hypothetical protein [Longimonas halophila]PEN05042.1 hypothetical protein CRI93_14100 [Longimonas halophila]